MGLSLLLLFLCTYSCLIITFHPWSLQISPKGTCSLCETRYHPQILSPWHMRTAIHHHTTYQRKGSPQPLEKLQLSLLQQDTSLLQQECDTVQATGRCQWQSMHCALVELSFFLVFLGKININRNWNSLSTHPATPHPPPSASCVPFAARTLCLDRVHFTVTEDDNYTAAESEWAWPQLLNKQFLLTPPLSHAPGAPNSESSHRVPKLKKENTKKLQ